MLKSFLLPTGLLASTIIGAGIFALPYVFAKSGMALGILYLVAGGIAYTIVHLMYADVIMRTKGDHRFPGYAGHYLGRFGFLLAVVTGVLEMVLVMTIYLILSQSFGNLITPHLGGEAEVILFWLFGSATIFVSVKRLTLLETLISVGILGIIATLFVLGFSNGENIAAIQWAPNITALFLPLAPVLFALSGRVAIPSLIKYTTSLRRHRMDKAVRRAIIWGTLIPVVVYFFFIIGISGLSSPVTEDSISGLIGKVSDTLLWVIGVLGLFTLWSSYIVVGFDINSILVHDFKFKRTARLIIVVILPLLLFILGLRNFLGLVSFVGGIFLAIEGLLVITMWWRANHKLKSSSLLMRGVPTILIWLTILTFLGALVNQLFS